MTNDEPDIKDSTVLSEDERAAMFAKTLATKSAGGVARFGQVPIPPKFVLFVALAFLVLGGGGALFDHFYGNLGQPSLNVSTTTVFKLPTTPVVPSGPEINASTKALMGLKDIANAQAAQFTLEDQSGRAWSLASARGKVVVLTFMNALCNDICNVLGTEIRDADSLLGASYQNIEFIIVNTDPHHVARQSDPPALARSGLNHLTNVHFLTGPVTSLNTVWIDYGVSIRVGVLPNQVAHNNVMYFIDPSGRLKSLAVPFGNENLSGVFSLSPPTMRRFAVGVAQTAVRLAG
ncbi:MAG: SCO family protein [Acidimicrobiaceae bacterium]|nr:SCO family protein [Acidimicrobiaceae bacterium]